MARIEYNPLVEAIHGRVGNYVLQDIRGVHSGRRLVAPRNPSSLRQQAQRRTMRNAVYYWSAEDVGIRLFYNELALELGGSGRSRWIQIITQRTTEANLLSDKPLRTRPGLPLDNLSLNNPRRGGEGWLVDWSLTERRAGLTFLGVEGWAFRNEPVSTDTPNSFDDWTYSGDFRSGNPTSGTVDFPDITRASTNGYWCVLTPEYQDEFLNTRVGWAAKIQLPDPP